MQTNIHVIAIWTRNDTVSMVRNNTLIYIERQNAYVLARYTLYTQRSSQHKRQHEYLTGIYQYAVSTNSSQNRYFMKNISLLSTCF